MCLNCRFLLCQKITHHPRLMMGKKRKDTLIWRVERMLTYSEWDGWFEHLTVWFISSNSSVLYFQASLEWYGEHTAVSHLFFLLCVDRTIPSCCHLAFPPLCSGSCSAHNCFSSSAAAISLYFLRDCPHFLCVDSWTARFLCSAIVKLERIWTLLSAMEWFAMRCLLCCHLPVNVCSQIDR